jgi:chromosomal replication initiator protein
MLLARRLTPLSYPDLGRRMGGKNHTTVIAACRRMEALIAANDYLVWHEGAVERRVRAAALIEDLEDQLHR